jgi:hypothetical protein
MSQSMFCPMIIKVGREADHHSKIIPDDFKISRSKVTNRIYEGGLIFRVLRTFVHNLHTVQFL